MSDLLTALHGCARSLVGRWVVWRATPKAIPPLYVSDAWLATHATKRRRSPAPPVPHGRMALAMRRLLSYGQVLWLVGLFGSVTAAILSETGLVPEPWHHRMAVLFVLSTALCGYMKSNQASWDGVTERRNHTPEVRT